MTCESLADRDPGHERQGAWFGGLVEPQIGPRVRTTAPVQSGTRG